MATGSIIGIIKKNCIEVTYCHYDGQLDSNGIMLDVFYKSSKKVEALISNGAIYELGKGIKGTRYMKDKKYNTLHYRFYKKEIQKFLKGRTKKYDMINNMIEDVLNLGDIIYYSYLYHEKLKKWLYIDMYELENIKIRNLSQDIEELNKDC